MKIYSLLGLAGLAILPQGSYARRDYANHDYYVLHLDRSTQPEHVALRLGLTHEGQLSQLDHHHVFRAPKVAEDVVKREINEHKRRKRALGGADILDGILLSRKQEARNRLEKRTIPPPPPGLALSRRQSTKPVEALVQQQSKIIKDLNILDPIFADQWHLLNTIQPGHDINVTGLWLEGITGQNATVAIVDDGLDFNSNDLKPNYFAEGSWDFNGGDSDPLPELSDDKHGTRCAGEVSAARNDVCGVGVAYDSRIAGIRILSEPISDADEAEALMYKYDENQIYSCSWGPPDDGRSMEAPDVIIRRAMQQSIQKGRDGLGSIYVFASGNGAGNSDNCNFDGYTNSIYSITVGAVDRNGQHPYYSELCSAQLVVTYSSGSGDAIHTTDVGEDVCYNGHGGTSAAAPLVAGIVALALQVRPDLSWRDIQYLAMSTSTQIDDGEAEWQMTASGKNFSHTFGYGKVDSYSLVQKAKDWKNVKPQAWFFSPWIHVKEDIPEGKDGLAVEFEVTKDMLKDANLERLEHVTVTMNVDHTRRGDLSVDLISPENVVSHIATARENDNHKGGYADWTFMSVAHWGESGVGKWKIVVKDNLKNENKGKFIDWHLKLWGESIDAKKAKPLPMPKEDDDADHDVIQSTTTLPASTTSAAPDPKLTESRTEAQPTDIPQRPTNPVASPSSTEEKPASGTDVAQETTSTATNWVSWLPTFGASKTAQAWIYGAVGLIGAFCCGLGIYFWVARRRRLRNNPRNNYEFELIDEEEAEGLNNGEKNVVGKGRRTRGGELYDAFAGGSDDDDEYDDYRDRAAERLAGEDPDHYVIGEESDDDADEKAETRPLGGERR